MSDESHVPIALCLISHTNAGKTTLARTLLGKDVGSVRDGQHVTQEATPYTLIETTEGDTLVLWDTPGFGDSARLARRLEQQANPVGWFLTQVWDRFRDRAFFLSQQIVRNVRDQADVVLYLVNASESPEDAGYVGPELRVLEWIGKPAIALINQTGRPRPREDDEAEETMWRTALSSHPIVRAITTLDAFARCWVQEGVLFDLVTDALPEPRRNAFARIVQAWQERRLAQFDDAMAALATPIAAAACDREPLAMARAGGALQDIGRSLGLRDEAAESAKQHAFEAMAMRLDEALRRSTDQIITLHGLEGHAKAAMLARLSTSVLLDAPVSEGKAAMMGGVVSGALTGLAADLATGGLTLGAGVVTGAVLGALGGAGIARGMNMIRGKSGPALRWDDAFILNLVASALLRYLAIAHYGRGRGAWTESETPAEWSTLVTEIVESRREDLARVWAKREPSCNVAAIENALRQVLGDCAREVLDRLYPGALTRRTGLLPSRDPAMP